MVAKLAPRKAGRPIAGVPSRAAAPAAKRMVVKKKIVKNKVKHSSGHLNLYDPRNPTPVPSVAYQGKAVPITVKAMSTFQTSSELTVLCISNIGSTATLGVQWQLSAVGGVVAATTLDAAQLTSNATAGGPTSGRAMKIGWSLANTTPMLSVSGRVHVLTTDRRLDMPFIPSNIGEAGLVTLANTLREHPDTRQYTGTDFVHAKHGYAPPRDDIEYNNFEPWYGLQTIDDFMRGVAVWTGEPFTQHRMFPMACTWIVIDHTPTAANSYQLAVRGSFYTRWPLDQVMSNMARDVSTAKVEALNKAAKEASIFGRLFGTS